MAKTWENEEKLVREKDFSEDIKIKCLLWSDRHCCLCGKACGTDIEIHHIEKDKDDLDNAVPLCYDCHSEVEKYNKKHPLGIKYRAKELKARREQIYERCTRHLVPPINWQITQFIGLGAKVATRLPKVGFNISHSGDFLPAKAKVKIRYFIGGKDQGLIENPEKPYYSGGILWNLIPRHTFFGTFYVPRSADTTEDLRLEVTVTIIDQYDRPHELPPLCYTYVKDGNYWITEPTSFNELERFMTKK